MGHDEMRIVSLLPSGTEAVAALGLANALVGRSHECDYPPEVSTLPVCTSSRIDTTGTSSAIDTAVREMMARALSLFEVDAAQITALHPTHIVTQDQCAACAVNLKDLEAALREMADTEVRVLSLEAARLGDVWAGIRSLGRELNVDAEDLTRSITRRIAKIAMRSGALGHDEDAPRVATIEWIEPVMVAGNWVPELVSIAGGESVLAELGEPSHEIAMEN
ncbi:MAG: cobalamin-binding protein, partial [Alphaproteobacteria bacterium]|nr:cobalamin-binding protein [Alphaproteobacteria bacterium]